MLKALLFSVFTIFSLGAQGESEKQPKDFYCGDEKAPIQLSDLSDLNLSRVTLSKVSEPNQSLSENYKGKWLVLNVSATWCWYCKTDLIFFNHYFANSENVVSVHMTYDLKREDRYAQSSENTQNFLKNFQRTDERFSEIPSLDFTHFYHSPLERDAIKSLESKSGEVLFSTMGGYPYQLIFDPEGNLVFRGHFTNKLESDAEDDYYAPFNRHYSFIQSLVNDGQCNPSLSGD